VRLREGEFENKSKSFIIWWTKCQAFFSSVVWK
jgi:hypothetical protein